MQVVELPGDVVDAAEHVQLALEELHRVAVALGWHVALVFQQVVFEVGQIELPQIIQARICVLASENVHIFAICSRSTSASWRWYAFIVLCINYFVLS